MLLGRIRQASATGAWLLRWAVLLIVKSSVSLLNSLLNGHVFMMTALYATLRYPLQSLSNGGEKLLIAGGNRWSWWLAKVAWTVAQALLYCVIAALIAAVFCLLSGGPLSLDTSPELMELYRYTGTRLSRQGMPGSLYCAFAVVCLVAMCLFQLMVSVAVHPVASFGVMLALLFASSFSSLTVFFGCYAMALRSDFFMANGIGGAAGCAFSCRDCRGVSRAGRRLL